LTDFERSGPPLVSVILCVYNGERYLREAIDCALHQTYPAVEVVVVDDGSTDGTDAICRSYGDRIRHLPERHLGLAGARNLAIRSARGRYVAILDHDDHWHPEKLTRQVRLFFNRPKLGLVYSNYLQINPAAQVMEEKSAAERGMRRGRVLPELYERNFIGNTTVVIPKPVLAEVGLFDERLCYSLDWDLWLRICHQHPIDYVDEALASWRWRPNYAEDHHEIMLREAYQIVSTRQPRLADRLTDAQNQSVENRLARISFSLGRLYGRAGRVPTAIEWIQRSIRHEIFTPEQPRALKSLEDLTALAAASSPPGRDGI